MPIRTRRGRSAAYRVLWEWPLYSPRRLVGCLAVVLAAGLAIGFAVAGGGSPGDTATPGGSAARGEVPRTGGATTIVVSPSGVPTPAPELTPASYPVTAAPVEALGVAARWTAAWVNHPPGTTPQQWLDRLRPYTTDEYLTVLSTVDPNNVPATRVTGPAVPVLVRDGSVSANVPTDTVTVRVLMVSTGAGGWRVAGYDRA